MKKVLYIVLTLFLYGCATTIPNFDQYQKSPLLNAEVMPAKEALEKKLPVVLVLDFEADGINEKSLKNAMQEYVANLLLQNKLVVLQDRKRMNTLKDEVTLAAIAGKDVDLKSVDYALGGQVSNVAFSSAYAKESNYYQNQQMSTKDKLLYQPEEAYQYTATVSGSITIYEIPTLKIAETISFHGIAKSTERVQSKGVGVFSAKTKAKTYDEKLVKAALYNGLSSAEPKLKDFFAKSGYILEKRTLNGSDIFMISLGTEDGIRQETRVVIMQKRNEFNLLSGAEEVNIERLTTGTVADKNSSGRSWIVVKEKDKASKIRLGDIVKVVY